MFEQWGDEKGMLSCGIPVPIAEYMYADYMHRMAMANRLPATGPEDYLDDEDGTEEDVAPA